MDGGQTKINIGDRVRVRFGSRAGEVATVANITVRSNQFGSYAQISLSFDGGEAEERGADSLEKIDAPASLRGKAVGGEQ